MEKKLNRVTFYDFKPKIIKTKKPVFCFWKNPLWTDKRTPPHNLPTYFMYRFRILNQKLSIFQRTRKKNLWSKNSLGNFSHFPVWCLFIPLMTTVGNYVRQDGDRIESFFSIHLRYNHFSSRNSFRFSFVMRKCDIYCW